MNRIALDTVVLVAAINGMAPFASVVAQQKPAAVPWSGCCGIRPWSSGMMGHGMMGGGVMPRMHFAMMSGVPAPYNSLSNPLENPRDG